MNSHKEMFHLKILKLMNAEFSIKYFFQAIFFNEADILESSSIPIYFVQVQSI